MNKWNVVGVFCDDVRDEVKNRYSLMGIMPDNLNVPKFPGTFARIGMSARAHLNVDSAVPVPIQFLLRFANGKEEMLHEFDIDFVRSEIAKARESGRPNAGFIMNVVMGGLRVESEGLIRLVVRFGEDEEIAAVLRVMASPISTSSEPPSEQSQPASPAS